MLVLTRKSGEKICIGDGITVTLLDVHGGRVRVGIDAPEEVRVLRGELAAFAEKPNSDPFARNGLMNLAQATS